MSRTVTATGFVLAESFGDASLVRADTTSRV